MEVENQEPIEEEEVELTQNTVKRTSNLQKDISNKKVEKKEKRAYTMTPARKEAFEKMKAARANNIQKRKENVEVQPKKPTVKKVIAKEIQQKNLETVLEEEDEEVVEVKLTKSQIAQLKKSEKQKLKPKPKKKVVLPDSSSSEESSSEDNNISDTSTESSSTESSSSEEEVIVKKKSRSKRPKKQVIVKKHKKKVEKVKKPKEPVVDNRNRFQKSGLTPHEFQMAMGF